MVVKIILPMVFLITSCWAMTLMIEDFSNKTGFHIKEDKGKCEIHSELDLIDEVVCLSSSSCYSCFYISVQDNWILERIEITFLGSLGTNLIVMSKGFDEKFIVAFDDMWRTYQIDVTKFGPKIYFFIEKTDSCDFHCMGPIKLIGQTVPPNFQFRAAIEVTEKITKKPSTVKYGRWKDEEMKAYMLIIIVTLSFSIFFIFALFIFINQKVSQSSW